MERRTGQGAALLVARPGADRGLTFSLVYGLVFCLLPADRRLAGHAPLVGPCRHRDGGRGLPANLYGTDGTALWLTLMTPGAAARTSAVGSWRGCWPSHP